jgi:hypothetical protein
MGGLVGEIALTAPRDAEPTACADADEACGARKRNFNYSTNVHNVMFFISSSLEATDNCTINTQCWSQLNAILL